MKKSVYTKSMCLAISVFSLCFAFFSPQTSLTLATETKPDLIKWIDFNASAEIMHKTIALVNHNSKNNGIHDVNFYEILSYVALQNGNKFDNFKDYKTIKSLKKKLDNGLNPIDKYRDNKHFKYYVTAFRAVLSGIIGRITDQDNPTSNYVGIVGYHPIAKGFWYNNYDDFGNSRSFGYKRLHLGNDLFGNIGTPILAIEGGTIQELGWNRFGGWRIGIRSADTNRYYYYAHLRKNKPYPPEFKKGDTVNAGQLVGYLGNTGYGKVGSTIKSAKPHLHLGMQIIFDPSQEKGSKEIWVDMYQIVRLLYNYRAISQPTKPHTQSSKQQTNSIANKATQSVSL